jgi:hypothetical protein
MAGYALPDGENMLLERPTCFTSVVRLVSQLQMGIRTAVRPPQLL